MYGTPGAFVYAECRDCACLQLLDRLPDLSIYYPTDYHSYRPTGLAVGDCGGGRLRRWLAGRRNAAQMGRARGLWRLLAWLRPSDGPYLPSWSGHLPELASAERILDVGCGGGELLARLAVGRYRALVGLDPFLPPGVIQPHPRVRLVRESLDRYQDAPFDLIMLHHSLEHMPDQKAALADVRRLLAPAGVCLIRVPIASGRPRQVYEADWVELDAPRHLFLHSRRSVERLAGACGLRVDRCWDDGTEFAYWGSELYRRGLSLCDPVTKRERDPLDHFTRDELEGYCRQARQDNEFGVGGRVAFVLRRN
jgi:SAM-dependent methyltransferase